MAGQCDRLGGIQRCALDSGADADLHGNAGSITDKHADSDNNQYYYTDNRAAALLYNAMGNFRNRQRAV
jgi:hypothetical protein